MVNYDMRAFRTRIAVPVEVRRDLERSQIFLSLDPEAPGCIRLAIVPAGERFSPVNQANVPQVAWIGDSPGPGLSGSR